MDVESLANPDVVAPEVVPSLELCHGDMLPSGYAAQEVSFLDNVSDPG